MWIDSHYWMKSGGFVINDASISMVLYVYFVSFFFFATFSLAFFKHIFSCASYTSEHLGQNHNGHSSSWFIQPSASSSSSASVHLDKHSAMLAHLNVLIFCLLAACALMKKTHAGSYYPKYWVDSTEFTQVQIRILLPSSWLSLRRGLLPCHIHRRYLSPAVSNTVGSWSSLFLSLMLCQ